MENSRHRFRAWDGNTMHHDVHEWGEGEWLRSFCVERMQEAIDRELCILMQYTGLKDKENLEYIYEGDILAPDGTIAGNRYENEDLLKDPAYILIEGMGTGAWRSAEQAAMERGCVYSK